jgi:hypothetical protein
MTDPSYIVAGGIAGWVLLMLAFPNDFMPRPKSRKTQVGPTFWGVYDGSPTEDDPGKPKIMLNELPITRRKAVAGSTMYAQGRAPSTRT